MIANVRSFMILRSGEVLTSSNKNNSANISGEESTMKHLIRRYLFFNSTREKL